MHTIYGYSATNFSEPISFDYGNTDFYYVTDFGLNKIIVFDSDWQFKFYVDSPNPMYVKSIKDQIYVTATGYFTIYDNYLNTTQQIPKLNLKGIDYNAATDEFTVAETLNTRITTYPTSLSGSTIVDLTPFTAFSVALYNGDYYVGTQSSQIIVVRGSVVIKNYNNVCAGFTTTVTSICFDQFGYMLISCHDNKAVFLYHSNGTYTGLMFNTTGKPQSIRYDSKGRLIVINQAPGVINIYY